MSDDEDYRSSRRRNVSKRNYNDENSDDSNDKKPRKAKRNNDEEDFMKSLKNDKSKLKPVRSGTNEERLNMVLKAATEIGEKMVTSMYGAKAVSKSKAAEQTNSKRHRGGSAEEELVPDEEEDGLGAGHFFAGQPTLVQGTMKNYQIEALNWLIHLHRNNVCGILADEMGLGKTLETISLLAFLHQIQIEQQRNSKTTFTSEKKMKHIVIVPKTTLGNWMNEFKKFCPSMKVYYFYNEVKEERHLMAQGLSQRSDFDVLITTYQVIMLEEHALKKVYWNYVIIDEAHRIKNEESILSQTLRKLKSTHRLLVTGTPLQNNLHELWALLNYLMPELFEDSADFDYLFTQIANEDSRDATIKALHQIIKPFMLRRIKAEVEKELLPKKEYYLFIGMSEMQKKWYKSIITKNFDALNAEKTRLLNLLMQLRKVCNHPYLFDGAEPQPIQDGEHMVNNCEKLRVLDMLLKKLFTGGHRALIFCQMTRMMDILEDYCLYRGWQYCRIDGSTSTYLRESYIDQYSAPGSSKFIFLLSTRAGGLGINLTSADTVVLYDSDFNPQMDLQAMDRAHRIGQTKRVNCYRLITEGTIEYKIVEKAALKLKMDHLVIQSGRLAQNNSKMNKNELQEWIAFGAQEILKAADSDTAQVDIEQIIEKSMETFAANIETKLSKLEDEFNLASFTSETSTKYMYEFQGKMFTEGKPNFKIENQFVDMIDLGQRERKKKEHNLNVDMMFRDAMDYAGSKSAKKKPKGKKTRNWRSEAGGGFDHQFFDEARLDFLEKKQNNYFEWVESGGDPNKEASDPAFDWTDRDENEFEKLKSEGYSRWSKKDFNTFIYASAKYGRENVRQIASELAKEEHDVKKYHECFWRRYKELEGWEKLMEKIDRGENEIKRQHKLLKIVKWVVAAAGKDPWNSITVDYKNIPKTFNQEEDVWLLILAAEHYMKNWEEVKLMAYVNPYFRFNWHIKTRTPTELHKRVELLARQFEKDYDREKEKMKKAKAKKHDIDKADEKERDKEHHKDTDADQLKRNRENKHEHEQDQSTHKIKRND